MREPRDTVKWIADACDGDAHDEARIISIGEAIEDYETIYGKNVLCRKALLEWLDVEIDLSSGNEPVLKADRWAFRQVKKAIESGEFDIKNEKAAGQGSSSQIF